VNEGTAWLDAFFNAYYRQRPVNATFIGTHTADHRLPDYSEHGAGDTLAEMRALLRESLTLDSANLTSTERLDIRLAQGFLRTQLWEFESAHFHRGNPCTYTGEAIFGVMSLFLTEYAPLAQRIEAATERMIEIPPLLEQGRVNVERAPGAWTQRALRECHGARLFFTEGIDLLIQEHHLDAAGLKTAAARAARAFGSFYQHLESELLPRASVEYACGEEAFGLYLREGHFIETDATEIMACAKGHLAEARDFLANHAADFGASNSEQALAGLRDLHPSPDGYYARYPELWEEVRRTAEARDVLSWPEFPIEYVPQPAWTRAAAPYLYFLPYRSPAAYNRPALHHYLVPPMEPTLSAADQNALLRTVNDSVIKLNHVIHHGGIGHHVQNWHAYHSASRIGQVAAVDCASRIAMFCGGTMAEGWACYATDLAGEIGALTPLEQYAEVQATARRCARAIVDVQLHYGRISFEQAVACYEHHAGMPHEGARAEVVKNSMFPGTALMYFTGRNAIHELRREMAARAGSAFDLRQFHDDFLSWGSIPVSVISESMKQGRLRAE
jgi:hypothetical protein